MARKKKSVSHRKTVSMPRKRFTRRVYHAARRTYRRSSGGWGGMFGKLKPLISGALGGFAYGFGKNVHAQFGGPAALAGVGYFMGNETLMTLSGIELAQSFGQNVGSAGGYL